MLKQNFMTEIRTIIKDTIPLLMSGDTSARFMKFYAVAKQDLSLAKLCEAHWDALNILAEARMATVENSLYGVWASEKPGNVLKLTQKGENFYLTGAKMFCSGAGLVDRALVTAMSSHAVMIDVDMNARPDLITFTTSKWFTNAFQLTNTSTVHFHDLPINAKHIISEPEWYVKRPAFWAGALGPAACWGGGAAGLVEYAQSNKRNDAHTLAHLGAMVANVWTIKSIIETAGDQIDKHPSPSTLHQLALITRHQIEHLCTDILRRFARAYGPFPLACDEDISRRYQELDLYLRQNHGERDLESLGKIITG